MDVLTTHEESLMESMEEQDMDTSSEDEEDMVVEVSRDEEPPSHGGVLPPVQVPPTLPEKGWEEVLVLGEYATEGDVFKLNIEKVKSYPDSDSACISLVATVTTYDEYDCTVATNVHSLGTGSGTDVHSVQYTGCTVDSKEVNGGPALKYLERTPSIVHGVHERFVDVQAMVKEWEDVESCKEEWEVKEGRRRGGRRVSKRMSELLGRFGEVDEQKINTLTDVNPDDKISFSEVIARGPAEKFTASFGKLTRENIKYDVTKHESLSGPTEGCDWLSSLPSTILTTNENQGSKKRKLEHETGRETKKRRVGST